ncbi:MAG: 30S ribosomal protein S4 [Deferribacterota bacterium]|nr:30S ribosomal protein S4 [Deferribacterota bacterium]
MARYTDSVCKLCRREGAKLFLKGERCFKDKCVFERKGYPPGQQGKRKRKMSDYGLQLREKQKVKRIYGVLENQFRNYFKKAVKAKGVTGTNLLITLERRLDNVVYRSGLVMSRPQARQFVTHGHICVNGKSVNIPSYLTKEGDIVSIRENSKVVSLVREAVETAEGRGLTNWLSLDKDKLEAKILRLPEREDVYPDIKEHLIVELYSK